MTDIESDGGDTTDSDCEHENQEALKGLISDFGSSNPNISKNLLEELFKFQKGMCRFTNISFSSGHFRPVLAPRLVTKEIDDSNSVLVIDILEKMRRGTEMGWREFISHLALISKEVSV